MVLGNVNGAVHEAAEKTRMAQHVKCASVQVGAKKKHLLAIVATAPEKSQKFELYEVIYAKDKSS